MKFTVLIPSYNHEKYISQTLESIVEQKSVFEHVEVLVIDDGSRDNSLTKIKTFENHLNLRLISHGVGNNIGAAATINEGLEIAAGDYVSIINSDDYFLKNHFEVVSEAIKRQEELILARPLVITSPNSPGIAKNYLREGRSALKKYGPVRALQFYNYFMSTSCMTLSKSLIEKTEGFDNFRLTHDWEFAFRAQGVAKVGVLDVESVAYREHELNTIRTGDVREHYFENALMRAISLIKNPNDETMLHDISTWINTSKSSTNEALILCLASLISNPKYLHNLNSHKPLGVEYFENFSTRILESLEIPPVENLDTLMSVPLLDLIIAMKKKIIRRIT